jgi:transposase
MKYNRHEELKTSGTGGTIIMTKARKTNMDERIKIVSHCIAYDKNYGETAEKFNVSYQQVYLWIKKYTARGIEGLKDRRGRSEPIDKPVTDIEILKAELELEKAKNQRLQVENDFLKKLEEIERRRY